MRQKILVTNMIHEPSLKGSQAIDDIFRPFERNPTTVIFSPPTSTFTQHVILPATGMHHGGYASFLQSNSHGTRQRIISCIRYIAYLNTSWIKFCSSSHWREDLMMKVWARKSRITNSRTFKLFLWQYSNRSTFVSILSMAQSCNWSKNCFVWVWFWFSTVQVFYLSSHACMQEIYQPHAVK